MKAFGFTLVGMSLLMGGLFAAEIGSDQLIDGFITYTGKAMSPKNGAPKAVTDDMRKGLIKHMGKEHPLFAPYVFEGATCDRAVLIEGINKNIRKCKASNIPLPMPVSFAATPKNINPLSDAELVIAHRLVDDLASRNEQQSEALDFVKECVRQVKRKDHKVFPKITDASILWDVEADVRKKYGDTIKWDEMFGKLSALSDDQITKLFEAVLILKHPGHASPQTLTDKRKPKERTVKGTYMRFEAKVAPKFRHAFRNKNDIGFGVYVIEGKKYWEPFGW